MNLLAISYLNIGPFKDTPLSCFFDQGKYLIKAPIGSGKSFLFFDGPLFGLYKIANRNMLNAQSKEGRIKIFFELDEEKYLVIRNLKAGKSKDSCSSLLYKISIDQEKFWQIKNEQGYAILEKNVDIEKFLRNNGANFEEISFKNETDLQQTLQSMLVPKEVFLNTSFLMQDSENIFQLTPADRLNVLKNVFNLLAIDEGKEIIADKKREVGYKLKATADTSKYDTKLQNLLNRYTENFSTLLTYKDYADLGNIVEKKEYQDFLDDIDLIREKVTITDFSLENLPRDLVETLQGRIDSYKQQCSSLQQSKELKEKELEKNKISIQDTQRKIQETEKTILSIDAKISGSDPEKLQKIKNEKNELLAQQEKIEEALPKQAFLDFYLKYEKDLDATLPKNGADIHISTLSLFVQGIITFGKNINEKVQNIDLQIKNEELRLSQQKTTREQDIKNTSEKIQDLQQQKENLEKKIQLFEQETEQQAAFDCSKIGTNCPFIKVINKQHFEKLEEQKKRFLEEKAVLEKNILTTQASKTQKEVQLQELLELSKTNQTISTHKAEQERLQSLISEIKSFLNAVNYSKLQEEFTSYQTQETKIKTLDKDISLLEDMLRQMETLRGEKEKCKIQITSMKETITQILKDQEAQEKEIITLNEKIQSLDPTRLQKVELLTTTIKETGRDLQVLINEFKDIQIEVKALQEEEKMLGELYNIFAKELLLLVLQDSLPVLNDIINNYLTQVVDYQIKFTLEKTGSDKLELAASILDERGEREIKSLSGGQMVVLKLVWMLSISSYLHSPMLFLDETINNLDGETVGKVAELLENFVHQRAMKLYTVTHSQHIQDMDIRDATIDISTAV